MNGLQVGDRLIHLGQLITNVGGCNAEIKRRTGIEKSAMWQLTKIWKSNDISKTPKSAWLRPQCFHIFGCIGMLDTQKTVLQRVHGLEIYCWRRMLRISYTDKRTNQPMIDDFKVKVRLIKNSGATANSPVLRTHDKTRWPRQTYNSVNAWRTKRHSKSSN